MHIIQKVNFIDKEHNKSISVVKKTEYSFQNRKYDMKNIQIIYRYIAQTHMDLLNNIYLGCLSRSFLFDLTTFFWLHI